MNVKYHQLDSAIGFLPRDSLVSVRFVLKRLLTRHEGPHNEKLSNWQMILLQSKVNGCWYRGEDMPQTNWDWPKNTWFQERLSHHHRNSAFTHARRQQ